MNFKRYKVVFDIEGAEDKYSDSEYIITSFSKFDEIVSLLYDDRMNREVGDILITEIGTNKIEIISNRFYIGDHFNEIKDAYSLFGNDKFKAILSLAITGYIRNNQVLEEFPNYKDTVHLEFMVTIFENNKSVTHLLEKRICKKDEYSTRKILKCYYNRLEGFITIDDYVFDLDNKIKFKIYDTTVTPPSSLSDEKKYISSILRTTLITIISNRQSIEDKYPDYMKETGTYPDTITVLICDLTDIFKVYLLEDDIAVDIGLKTRMENINNSFYELEFNKEELI